MTIEYLSASKQNAYVEVNGSEKTLYSYHRPILTINGNQLVTVHPDWDASQTTAKHRNLFIQEYLVWYGNILLRELSNAQLKKLLQRIYTGEAVKVAVKNPKLIMNTTVPQELKDNYKFDVLCQGYSLSGLIIDNRELEINVNFTVSFKLPKELANEEQLTIDDYRDHIVDFNVSNVVGYENDNEIEDIAELFHTHEEKFVNVMKKHFMETVIYID